jgi:hypothetical protein
VNVQFITRAYGASKLLLRAKAPTLMVVGGVTAMGAGTVLACKQTLKVEEILEKHTPDLEKIKEGERLMLNSYTPKIAQGDRFRVYSRAGLDLTKLYSGAGVLFIGGACLVFGGHRILVQRNATLAIAFTGLKKTFDQYRARVVDKIGHDADQAFYSGAVVKEVYDDETGEVQTIATRDWTADQDPYNRIFEQGASTAWEPDLAVNRMFIQQQQKFAQHKLNAAGHLYLSEVYAALGFPESDISRVVGWKVKRNPDGSKDFPMVDFGLDKPMPDDWKFNKEKAVYLDFNCQGLIVGGKLQKILERA